MQPEQREPTRARALELALGPDFRGPLEQFGDGFRSAAFIDGGDRVILVGKVPETAAGYALSARSAQRLARELPAAIPAPVAVLGPGPGLPGGALIYPRLPGRHPNLARLDARQRDRFATDLAAFLRALHRIPHALVVEWSVPERSRTRIDAELTELWPALRRTLSRREMARLDRWRIGLMEDPLVWNAPRALCHGDFWHENLLLDLDSGRLTGVLDLEELAIADPASDFAPLRHLSAAFADEVRERYDGPDTTSPHFERRVERHWELREFGGLLFALRYDDRVEWEDGLRKLRTGPILGAPGAHTTTVK